MCATATPPPPCPEGGQGNTGENQTHFPNTAAIDTQAHRRRLDTAATNMQAAVCLSLLLPHLKLFKDLGNIYEKKILEDRSALICFIKKKTGTVSVEFQGQKIFPSETLPFKVHTIFFKRKIGTENITNVTTWLTRTTTTYPPKSCWRVSGLGTQPGLPSLTTKASGETVRGKAPEGKETIHRCHFSLYPQYRFLPG